MPDESKSDVVPTRPFAMARDCRQNRSRKIFTGKHLQDLRFGKERIVEDHVDELLIPFREERAGYARRPAPRQSESLAEWKLRKPRDQLVLSIALQLRRRAWKESELYEIHQV